MVGPTRRSSGPANGGSVVLLGQHLPAAYLQRWAFMLPLESSEKVVFLEDFPQSSVGAPCPAVIATEHSLVLIFFLQVKDPNWDGKTVRVVSINSAKEPCAVVHFESHTIHSLGPPNDEAFGGHRLAEKGLQPYGAFEVINSGWIKQLEKMNSVHSCHDRERFLKGKRHFIVTFHDSVFECVAHSYRVELTSGSIKELLVEHSRGIDF